MNTHATAPINSGEKEIEQHLMTLAADGDDIAIGAIKVADTWPHPTVRKRELPLFTGYGLSLNDILVLHAQAGGPAVHVVENGEPLYGKWAVSFWLYTLTKTPPDVQPSTEKNIVNTLPNAWGAHQNAAHTVACGPYEVALHRLAEAGDWAARNMILCAVYWPRDTVTLGELEQFSHATVVGEDCYLWVWIAYGKEASDPETTFDKWEISYWIYDLLQAWPSLLGIPILKPAVKAIEENAAPFVGADMDWDAVRDVYRWLLNKNYVDEGTINVTPEMLATGYEKLAARAGMTADEYKALTELPQPEGDYDMDERAALLDANDYFKDPDIAAMTPADLLAFEERVDDVAPWELQLFIERTIKRLPWPVDRRPFPWNK